MFNQILYGCHMPPYYSVLNFTLMEKLIGYLQNPKSMSKLLLVSRVVHNLKHSIFFLNVRIFYAYISFNV